MINIEADDCGFPMKAGFFTSYFRVSDMIESSKGKCSFRYELRNSKTPHPCAQMKFAQYTNDIDETRQASAYFSSVGHFYFQAVEKVSSWVVRPENVTIRFGWVDGFPAKLKDGSTQLLRNYGLYVPDNIYFGNAIVQIDAKSVENIKTELEQYSIEISNAVDVITVDDAGNVIDGLYKLNSDNTKYDYRISPAVFVKKGNEYLIEADSGDDAAEGTYKMYVTPKNCTAEIINGTVCVTAIDNIKDGVSGTSDDVDFDYDAMRKMESISVVISVMCEGIGSITKEFKVAIKHDSKPYISMVMDNQNASVSWNTKAQKYIGLPYSFNITAARANDLVPINKVSIVAPEGVTVTSGMKDGMAVLTVTSLPQTLANVTDIKVTATATYVGISYEQTLVHTLNRYEDVNVYELKPSVTQVVASVNTNGEKVADVEKVTCSVLCSSSDDKQYTLTTEQMTTAKAVVKYSIDDSSTLSELPADGLSVSPEWSKIVFHLLIDGSEVDSQDVPVMLNGVDGNGIEYVFLLTTEDKKPTIYDDSSTEAFQSSDYCPYTDAAHTRQWTDEPTGVGINNRYEWVAQRKKQYGKWLPFSEAKKWTIYAMDGTSPYSLDLTNESSQVLCDQDGNVIGGYETTTIQLFHGASVMSISDFTITITATNISYSLSGAVITPSAFVSGKDSAQIAVKAVLKTNTSIVLTAVYSITKNKAGKDGVVYSLQPSVSTFAKDSNGDWVTKSFHLYVKKTAGTGATEITTLTALNAEGLTLKYGSTTVTSSTLELVPSTICGSNTYADLYLYKGGVVIDRERINVVSDGDPGPQGKPGQNGNDAVIYSLVPNMTSIIIDDNNKLISGSSLSVTLYKTAGSSTAQSTNYKIFAYSVNNKGEKTVLGQSSGNPSPFAVDIPSTIKDDLAAYYFEVHDSNNTLAVLTVPVVRHGKPSISIVDRGLFDKNSAYYTSNGGYSYKYVNGTLVRDMVKYLSNNAYYYYMVKNRTDLGSGNVTVSPDEDSSKWEQASKYNLLVADVVYADNATFGGFHVNKDAFWTGAEEPENATILLDGKSKKVRVTGEVNATSGTFGNCAITNTCRIHQTGGNGWFLVGAQVPSEDKPNGTPSWWLGYSGVMVGSFSMEVSNPSNSSMKSSLNITPNIPSPTVTYANAILKIDSIYQTLASFNQDGGMNVQIGYSIGEGIRFTKNISNNAFQAFVGSGHGCLNGVVQGYQLNVVTSGLIDISKGNTVYCNGVSTTLALPKLSDCRKVLGTAGAFALDLTIIAASGASNFRVEGSDHSTLTDCKLVSNNHAAWYATMSQGDVLQLKLISNGSTLIAYIVSLFN